MLWRSPFLLFECFFRARQKQFQIEYGNSEYSGISSIFESWIIYTLYMCIYVRVITFHIYTRLSA